jgi:hypothetical protein
MTIGMSIALVGMFAIIAVGLLGAHVIQRSRQQK